MRDRESTAPPHADGAGTLQEWEKTMQSIRVARPGGAAELRYTETATPVPAEGQVLVRNAAVGVNFTDVYYRDGTYPLQAPFTPGQEAAGVVAAVGAGVTGFAPGAPVAYATQLGAYAEYTLAEQDRLIPLPDGVDPVLAATVTLQGLAAYYLTHQTHPVAEGETVVVLAAAGGLGSLLVQLAAARGATVIAVASTAEKEKTARAAGARHTLGYDGFDEAVLELTGGRGARVVYDSVGAPTYRASLRSLGRRGLLALCGASGGAVASVDVETLRGGSLFVTRPAMKDYLYDAATLRTAGSAVFRHLADGVLRPHVHAELPLRDAEQAHRLLESRATTGKLLLIP
ncbi:quinone oxidoreductase family protein [Actinacidiphila sp. ITFR-21]|uniref:quinone oxidoreductase family protein n=1 Tax=Actinacidiphila sp. ITFR-21 TaxID=3075199 RepID=UPI00288A91E6|nr:quinone oxidoreductase [Streptomyces sp. ITFR-21]WNI15012.1 quinone oxidoreductase [Streptomyces sp. ITFR-21]